MTAGDRRSYDEREALTAFVLGWYGRLMTVGEREDMRAIQWEEKVRALHGRDDAAASAYRERGRRFTETQAAREAMRIGADEFRRRVCDRILADHPHEVVINRCPRCRRIVRTPKAEQCLWCGNDWHTRRPDSTMDQREDPVT